MTSMTAPSVAAPANARGASDWLLLIVPGAIWGTSFLFIAEGLRSIGPGGVTFVRVLVGFLTLGLFPAARRAIPREDWSRIALLGLIWMAFPLSMFPFAEQRVSSALTGMLNGTIPLFTATVEAFHARRVPPKGVLAGLAVGTLGAVLMSLPSLSEGHSSAIGVLLILAAVICYGFVLPIAVPLQQRHGALAVIWRAQAVALVLTAPLGVPDLLAAQWTPGPLLSLIALGAFGTGIAYVVLTISAARVGPTRASATTFLIPVVSLALGVAVRGEHVAALAVLGAAVCLAGAVMIRRARARH